MIHVSRETERDERSFGKSTVGGAVSRETKVKSTSPAHRQARRGPAPVDSSTTHPHIHSGCQLSASEISQENKRTSPFAKT
jgi:hypothetical protein